MAGGRTAVLEMLPKLHVSVPSGGDVEIPLDLVPLDAPEDPARVRPPAAPDPGRLAELAPSLRQREVVVHVLLVRILPRLSRAPLPLPLVLVFHAAAGASSAAPAGGAPRPYVPHRVLAREPLPGHDAVAAGVLDVDVHIGAAHGDDHVQVDLQLVRDAGLDGEGVGGDAAEPAGDLSGGEIERQEGEEDRIDGPVAGAG